MDTARSRVGVRPAGEPSPAKRLSLTFSDHLHDREWDAFVERVPGGHHLQTSAWADVKAVKGWRCSRLVLDDGRRLVGGCQLLVKPVSGLGSIVYAPRGPLVADGDERIAVMLLEAVIRHARQQRALLLKVQPASHGPELGTAMVERGFRRSQLWAAPVATVMLDLAKSQDELRRAAQPKVRQNMRRAARLGVTVRLGDAGDLSLFHQLVQATAGRQGFDAYPLPYYTTLWRRFSAKDQAVLLVAERGGRALAALLLVAFQETVLYKMGGWDGGPERPNELLHWAAATWAQERGYRWYDFEGIDAGVAAAALRGEPPSSANGVTRFKLAFGGDVVMSPGAFDLSPLPAVVQGIGYLTRFRGGRALVHRLQGRQASQ